MLYLLSLGHSVFRHSSSLTHYILHTDDIVHVIQVTGRSHIAEIHAAVGINICHARSVYLRGSYSLLELRIIVIQKS